MNRKSFIKILGLTAMGICSAGLKALSDLSDALPNTPRMPALFLGHGSPMNAIEENQFVTGFRNISKSLPKPNLILCVSAHWYINGTKVTAMENPKTIHDFGGFPKALFDVEYPAKGSPDLAKQTKEILAPTPVELDLTWGLDHGAWSVIKHLYPNADVPVVQLSIDRSKPAEYHFDLGKRLNSLRDKGVLIIGSGNIVHNLYQVDFANIDTDNYGYDWAREAREIVNKALISGDANSLINYTGLGKAVQLAAPTPDHFLPLLYVLGLRQKTDELSLFNDKLVGGSLSMTSVKIGN